MKTLDRKLLSRSKRKFLRFFPKGFQGEKYTSWERGYKWEAHRRWQEELSEPKFKSLLEKKKYKEIADKAIRIESKTNLLFSFEKMALRDAVKTSRAAQIFSEGLFDYLYGSGDMETRFNKWAESLKKLPVKKTRVHTWPLQTVFGFIAKPGEHIFLKPRVTQAAAAYLGYDFHYHSRPNWTTYKSILNMARAIKKGTGDLQPRDNIDLQSFIWVMGSDEYPD